MIAHTHNAQRQSKEDCNSYIIGIFPSQVFDMIYPLTDLAMLLRSSKFPSVAIRLAGSNHIASYC